MQDSGQKLQAAGQKTEWFLAQVRGMEKKQKKKKKKKKKKENIGGRAADGGAWGRRG